MIKILNILASPYSTQTFVKARQLDSVVQVPQVQFLVPMVAFFSAAPGQV